MRIGVIGTGYVGLVTGTCFSECGNRVVCMDINSEKIQRLNAGELTIFEPGLDKLFLKNLRENRLTFTISLEELVLYSDIIFLALPTPSGENGSADLQYILDVATKLGKLLVNYKLIINKSTVPVGTVDKVKAAIKLNYHGEFDVVSNPEFLREGVAVDDFMKPDRIIIGTNSKTAKEILIELYAPFIRQGNPIIFMDERSSELSKYAANAFLATKISFMNEIANLCELVGADVDCVRRGIGSDERIGKRFLFPGIGYGGSCFPKDVKALITSSEEVNYDFKILKSVENVNLFQKELIFEKVNEYFNYKLKGKHFALWGLSFKPNTDDIREAPSIVIIDKLLYSGATISVFDPEATSNIREIYKDKIDYSENPYSALIGSDALIIATEWSEFRTPDFEQIGNLLGENKVIFDGRNIYDVLKMKELGFHYVSIGRKLN